ncbi:hypothetical protein FHT21_002489 [Pedobacter sp. SG908]|nr:hypothetical protein [Pedobacter sp. SG908]
MGNKRIYDAGLEKKIFISFLAYNSANVFIISGDICIWLSYILIQWIFFMLIDSF